MRSRRGRVSEEIKTIAKERERNHQNAHGPGIRFIAREGQDKDLFFHSKELQGVTFERTERSAMPSPLRSWMARGAERHKSDARIGRSFAKNTAPGRYFFNSHRHRTSLIRYFRVPASVVDITTSPFFMPHERDAERRDR